METYYPPYGQDEPTKHSGLGIASTVLGVVAIVLGGVMMALIFVIAGSHLQELQSGNMRNPPPALIAVGCGFYLSPLLALIGLVLGIIGLFQSTRKKAMAITGTAINGLILLGLVCILCAGVAGRMH